MSIQSTATREYSFITATTKFSAHSSDTEPYSVTAFLEPLDLDS